MRLIKCRIDGGRVEFDDQEIRLWPTFARRCIGLSWGEIDFISITPSVKKYEDKWLTFQNEILKNDKLIGKHKTLSIDVVVKDRTRRIDEVGWFTKNWYLGNLKPLYNADDIPEPLRGYIELKLNLRTISEPIEDLLDLLKESAKFDLLCFFD